MISFFFRFRKDEVMDVSDEEGGSSTAGGGVPEERGDAMDRGN